MLKCEKKSWDWFDILKGLALGLIIGAIIYYVF